MNTIYPFATGSLYTASYAITSSYAENARLLGYTTTASIANRVLNPRSGSAGKNVCLLTTEQYRELSGSLAKVELCIFT